MTNKLVVFLILFLLRISDSYCVLGCMDNSMHLATRCDYKKYHYVQCDCPCSDVIDSRGTCRRCLHFGNPNRGALNSLQDLFHIYR